MGIVATPSPFHSDDFPLDFGPKKTVDPPVGNASMEKKPVEILQDLLTNSPRRAGEPESPMLVGSASDGEDMGAFKLDAVSASPSPPFVPQGRKEEVAPMPFDLTGRAVSPKKSPAPMGVSISTRLTTSQSSSSVASRPSRSGLNAVELPPSEENTPVDQDTTPVSPGSPEPVKVSSKAGKKKKKK